MSSNDLTVIIELLVAQRRLMTEEVARLATAQSESVQALRAHLSEELGAMRAEITEGLRAMRDGLSQRNDILATSTALPATSSAGIPGTVETSLLQPGSTAFNNDVHDGPRHAASNAADERQADSAGQRSIDIASASQPADVIAQTSETPSSVAYGRQTANMSEAVGLSDAIGSAADDDEDPFSQIDSGLKIDLVGYKSPAPRTDRLLDHGEEQRTRDMSQTSLAMSKAFDKVEKLAASFALCRPRLLECLEAIASHYQLRSVSLSNRPIATLLDAARRQDAGLATLAAVFWARVTSAAVLSVADCETAGLVLKDCPQCKANSQEDIGAYLVVLKRREAQGTVEYGYSGATTQAFSKRWKAHTDGSSTSSTKRLASEDTEALIMLAITSTGVRRSLRTLFLVRLWESIVGVAWPLRRAMAVRTVAQLDELLVMCYFSTRQGGFEGVSRGNVDFEPLNQHIPGAIGQVEAGYLGDLSDDDSEVDEEADHDVHITETDDDVADLERASLGTLHFSLG